MEAYELWILEKNVYIVLQHSKKLEFYDKVL